MQLHFNYFMRPISTSEINLFIYSIHKNKRIVQFEFFVPATKMNFLYALLFNVEMKMWIHCMCRDVRVLDCIFRITTAQIDRNMVCMMEKPVPSIMTSKSGRMVSTNHKSSHFIVYTISISILILFFNKCFQFNQWNHTIELVNVTVIFSFMDTYWVKQWIFSI